MRKDLTGSYRPWRSGRKRVYAAVFALVGWFALILQLFIMTRDRDATIAGVLSALWTFVRFFTILTNILVAVWLTRTALGAVEHPSLATGLALNIAFVGLVYSLILRAVWDPAGWQLVADHLLHDVMPLAYLGYWVVFIPHGRTRWRDVGWWLLYPIGYVLYALTRGAIDGKYAYPFIDVTAIGYPRVLLNAAGLMLVFTIAGGGFVALDRWLGRRVAR